MGGKVAVAIVALVTLLSGQEPTADAGSDSCLDVERTAREYFGRGDDSDAQWLARRYCQMKVASFEKRSPKAPAAVRCVLHETFENEMPVVTLDARDCVLWRVDWNEDRRTNVDEKAIPDPRCRQRLQRTLDAFAREQTPSEVEDANPGVTLTKVDGSEWHRLGRADIEERPELETPAALACTALFCATGTNHALCRRDGGTSR